MGKAKSSTGLAEQTQAHSVVLFGELLISKGLITKDDLAEALSEQRENGGRLGEVLIRLKKLSEEDVTRLDNHFIRDLQHPVEIVAHGAERVTRTKDGK